MAAAHEKPRRAFRRARPRSCVAAGSGGFGFRQAQIGAAFGEFGHLLVRLVAIGGQLIELGHVVALAERFGVGLGRAEAADP